jgi:hypothetical protein
MSRPFVNSHFRAKLVTVALVVGLVGGTLAIDTVASQLSSEIGRTDRSASVPAPAASTPGQRESFGTFH